jgi:hypothetical protein
VQGALQKHAIAVILANRQKSFRQIDIHGGGERTKFGLMDFLLDRLMLQSHLLLLVELLLHHQLVDRETGLRSGLTGMCAFIVFWLRPMLLRQHLLQMLHRLSLSMQ